MNLTHAESQRVLEVISKFSKKISKLKKFSDIVFYMAEMAKELVEADRCTIWIYDEIREDLWIKTAQGMDNEIRISANVGIVGHSVKTKEPIVVNNPYEDDRFNKAIDMHLGYRTKSILTYPIFAENDRLIGVIQTVNKADHIQNSDYLEKDIELLSIAAALSSKILIGENYERINDYNEKAQKLAFEKQKTAVVNQIENDERFNLKIIYKPADVLTGDIYSIYKTNDDGLLVFVVDAMGHGIMPALTSYAVASLVKQHIKACDTLQDLASHFQKSLHTLLADGEQVSCCFIWLDKDLKTLEYFSGGMYPPKIKHGNGYIDLKANNLPFMEFTKEIVIQSQDINGFEGLFIYSDGIIEDDEFGVKKDELNKMFDEIFFDNKVSKFLSSPMEDDLTLILLKKSSD